MGSSESHRVALKTDDQTSSNNLIMSSPHKGISDETGANSRHTLHSLDDLGETAEPGSAIRSPRIDQVLDWARTFLSAPHPDLGRPGHVCPFVKPALDTHKSLYFAELSEQDGHPEHIQEELLALLHSYREKLERHKSASPFLAAIIIPPESYSSEAGFDQIKAIQSRLKPLFAKLGLMIGQLHPLNTEPGLHNPEFRPLQSPVPLFVYRIMQINDLPFLCYDETLLNAYKTTFRLHTRTDLEKGLREARIPQLPIGWKAFVDQAFD